MNTATPELLDTTITAQGAPLGVLLWPVRDEQYAPNYTLDAVDIVRDVNGTYVRWVYQNGKTRRFQLGEQVAVRVVHTEWPASRDVVAIPTQAAATHHADEVATRPASTIRHAKLTRTQEAYLKWYATGDIRQADGVKGTAATGRRLEQLRLAESCDAWPYYRPTDRGRQWLTAHGFGHLTRKSSIG